jgi:hypothetical protein
MLSLDYISGACPTCTRPKGYVAGTPLPPAHRGEIEAAYKAGLAAATEVAKRAVNPQALPAQGGKCGRFFRQFANQDLLYYINDNGTSFNFAVGGSFAAVMKGWWRLGEGDNAFTKGPLWGGPFEIVVNCGKMSKLNVEASVPSSDFVKHMIIHELAHVAASFRNFGEWWDSDASDKYNPAGVQVNEVGAQAEQECLGGKIQGTVE